jgi:hypothetical protein
MRLHVEIEYIRICRVYSNIYYKYASYNLKRFASVLFLQQVYYDSCIYSAYTTEYRHWWMAQIFTESS